MTTPENSQPEVPKQDDKEINFRRLEARYQKQLEAERNARMELEKKIQESQKPQEEDDDEPYVDKRKLERKFSNFERDIEQKIEKKAEEKARQLMYQEKQNDWLKKNPDFFDVLKGADKIALEDPELADTILELPDTFERQKIVYKYMKKLAVHEEKAKQASIQSTLDAKRQAPYYAPSGVATSPYVSQGDFSDSGRKNSYDHVQQLIKRLRLG